jgi:hypothetical protein
MVTPEPLAWVQVGTTEDGLLKELLELYWEGLEVEMADAILSLNNILRLRKKYPEAGIKPQEIEHRVSARLGPPILAWNPLELDWHQQMDCVTEAGKLAWDQQDFDEDYLMARMMLSGLNMLDFDEIIEYRDPPLPSQRGPPRCLAVKSNTGGPVAILVLECNICHEPLRGLAWTCRLGCKSNVENQKPVADSLYVCTNCYREGRHPRQHLVRSPHRYGISETLRTELSPDEFWSLRREIQRRQYELDLRLDRSKGGIINSTMTRALVDWSRSIFPLGNAHASVMFVVGKGGWSGDIAEAP